MQGSPRRFGRPTGRVTNYREISLTAKAGCGAGESFTDIEKGRAGQRRLQPAGGAAVSCGVGPPRPGILVRSNHGPLFAKGIP